MADLLLHEAAVNLSDPAHKQIAEVGGKGILFIGQPPHGRALPRHILQEPHCFLFFKTPVNNLAV
jgi:hypothetical protein